MATGPDSFVVFQREFARLARSATPAIALEVCENTASAALAAAAAGLEDAEVHDIRVRFMEGRAILNAHVRVRGKAWPPRPPVDTEMSLTAGEFKAEAASRRLKFTVVEPLSFSSGFAEILVGLFGRWLKGGPVSLDQLRNEGETVTVDFAELMKGVSQEIATAIGGATLTAFSATEGMLRLEFDFVA